MSVPEPVTPAALIAHRQRLLRYRHALREVGRMIERGDDMRAIAHAVQMLSQDVARGLVSLYDAPVPSDAEPSRALAVEALTAVRAALRSRALLGSADRFRALVMRADGVLAHHEERATHVR